MINEKLITNKNDYVQLRKYVDWIEIVGTPVSKLNLPPKILCGFNYIWKEEDGEPKSTYNEYDFFPLAFVTKEKYKDDKSKFFYQGINLHHLPYIIRQNILSNISVDEEILLTAIRRYIPSSIGRAFIIPKKFWNEAIRFTSNTYYNSTYPKRFGSRPKFESYYIDKPIINNAFYKSYMDY